MIPLSPQFSHPHGDHERIRFGFMKRFLWRALLPYCKCPPPMPTCWGLLSPLLFREGFLYDEETCSTWLRETKNWCLTPGQKAKESGGNKIEEPCWDHTQCGGRSVDNQVWATGKRDLQKLFRVLLERTPRRPCPRARAEASHDGWYHPLGPESESIHPGKNCSITPCLSSQILFHPRRVQQSQRVRKQLRLEKTAEVDLIPVPQLRPHMGSVEDEWKNVDWNDDYSGIETVHFDLGQRTAKSIREFLGIWPSFHPGPGEDFCTSPSPPFTF